MYEKLNIACSVADELLAAALVAEFRHVPDMIIADVPKAIVLKDKLLYTVAKEFNVLPYFFKFLPHTWYNWHKDTSLIRKSAMNMLVKSTSCHTLFMKKKLVRPIYQVEELQYEPSSLYLFDTQQIHAVLNLQDARVILSFGFKETYAEAQAKCKSIGLL